MDMAILTAAAEAIRNAMPDARPVCGLVLGSGLSDAAGFVEVRGTVSFADIPGLGAAGVKGHAGEIALGSFAGLETIVFAGRRHWYEGEGWEPIAIPIFAMNVLNVRMVTLTNAAGGVAPTLGPGDLMMITDHINMMSANPLIGPHDPRLGPRFPDQSDVYDKQLRQQLADAAVNAGVELHEGVYAGASGPTYETPAEVSAYSSLGASAVGMSTVPEAMLATSMGMRVAGISCIANKAMSPDAQGISHDEVVAAIRAAIPQISSLLQGFWEQMATDQSVIGSS